MAQAQLDNILDALKLLPLDLQRNLALIYTLDQRINSQDSELTAVQDAVMQQCATADTKADRIETLNEQLRQMRALQHDKYSLSLEKHKIGDELKSKLYSYIQRIDEDCDAISSEHPHMLEQYTTQNEPLFDTYAGQRAASKGLTLASKSPKFTDLSLSHDEAIYAPPRRRAANNAIDMMRSELADDDDDEDYVESNTNKQFGNLVMTNTVNLGEIELSDPVSDGGADTRLYCTCQQPSYGEMVGCDNDACPYEWFHLQCVGLKKPPKQNQKWYCFDCSRQRTQLGDSGRQM